MSEEPEAKKRVRRRRKTEFTVPESARFLKISNQTMYNWVNADEVDWHWKKSKKGRKVRVLAWETLCELRRAYPTRLNEETVENFIATRRSNGKLRTGGKPGTYKPKSKKGYESYDERQLGLAEAVYYEKKWLLMSEEERAAFLEDLE